MLLFVATTFASAFLIFLVQPLVAKRIVPWFGGVPAVWSLCLAFYQTTLFVGYAYAHVLLRRASPVRQLAVHAAVVVAAALALPVLPGERWKPEGSGDPSAAILAMLFANVALPFFVLAATGPLVAAWFSRRHPTRSPYPLYAVSNLGSLVALIAYPFALEPHLPLSKTGELWSGAFIATGAAVIACAGLARSGASTIPPTPAGASARTDLRFGLVTLWVTLAACAVVILMGVTNQLCLDLASVPFLWIVPLAIYLATLILCFGVPRIYRRAPYVAAAALVYFAPWIIAQAGLDAAVIDTLGGSLRFHVLRHAALLFTTCMVLHGELHRLRPPARSLSAYYLCTSAGGALGGISVGVLAPRAFDDFHELPLGLAIACVLLLAACREDVRGWLRRSAPGWRWVPALALTASALAYGRPQAIVNPDTLLHQERNFFGVLRVQQYETDPGRHRALEHGSTLHGAQLEAAPELPTAYYGVHTGIGLALLPMRDESDPPAKIGVIGLGIGTLAAYGRPGDRMRFFEIDPAVIRLARDRRYFTYLANATAEIEIVGGDGRISLAREREQDAPRYDYLIVDAYSSDAVPVHLLTREAVALYVDSLQPPGLLAFNISNRYFDLMPALGRLADDAGVPAVSIQSAAVMKHASGAANWVFLSRDEARIEALAKAAEDRHRLLGLPVHKATVRTPTREEIAGAPLWTDDYSDLLGALARRGSRSATPQ